MPVNFSIPPDSRAPGTGNPAGDMDAVIDALQGLRADRSVLNAAYAGGADPTGTADSTAAINAAYAASGPGQVVFFRDGIYKISAPLTPPPGVITVMGLAGFDPATWTDGSSGCVIQPSASFTGNAVFQFADVSHALTQGPAILGGAIDGSALTVTADGIRATGPVNAVVLANLFIANVTGAGINCVTDALASGQTYPYGWHLSHVKIDSPGQQGIACANHTDATFTDVHVIGSAGHGWSFAGPCPNSRFVGCKAEWTAAGSDGFHLTGSWSSGAGSGGMVFAGCSTDRCGANGLSVTATGTVPVIFTGCMFRRDGRNSGTGGGGFAGISLSGSTIPVVISGVTVFPGTDDNGTGTSSPQYGLSVASSAANITIGHGYIQGATASRNNDNTGLNVMFSGGLAFASGTTASPALDTSGTRTAISSPVTVSNTTTETPLVSLGLPPGILAAGSTYRINVMGTVQVQATSGTLTFKPYIGGTAAQTPQMATQGSAAGPVAFWLEMYVSVDTTGTSGTYVAHGRGEMEFSSRVNLVTSSTTTTAVNTVTAATVKLTATWATASATNILTVSIATIEQVA